MALQRKIRDCLQSACTSRSVRLSKSTARLIRIQNRHEQLPCTRVIKNARAAVMALIKWLIHASYLLYLYPESHIPEPQWPAVSVNSCGWVVHSCGLKHLECFPVFLLSDVVWISQNTSDEMATCMTQALFDASFFGNSFRSFGFFTRMKCQGTLVETFPQSVAFVKWYQFTVVSYRNIICLWKMFEKVCFCP